MKTRSLLTFILILVFACPADAMTLRISANGNPDPGDSTHCFPGDPVTLAIHSPDGYAGTVDNTYFVLAVDTQYGHISGGSVSPNAPMGTSIAGEDAQSLIGPPQDGIWGSILSVIGSPTAPDVYIEDILYIGQLVGQATVNLYSSKDLENFFLEDSIIINQDLEERIPLGTAFTYQGMLLDANSTANDSYDFRFSLEAVAVGDHKLSSDVLKDDVKVIDGYFTVELDFGSDVFDDDTVWLEIAVRPGDSNDPNAYTTLTPRQRITAAPYALRTRGISVGNDGKVGLGTSDPNEQLHVAGRIKIVDGTEGDGKILTSDANGTANWQDPPGFDALPSGVIVLWYGNIAGIPSGWALCDGSSGTPDLRDRFVVGARQDEGGTPKTNVTGTLSQTGGSVSHSHTGSTSSSSSSEMVTQGTDSSVSAASHTHSFTSDTTLNAPPYYALAYIMKL